MSAVAGWYLDGHQPSHERWWDGQQWTEHVRPVGPTHPAVPTAPSAPYVAAPASRPGTGLAVTSLAASLLWLLWVGSVAAIVTGIMALRRKVTGGAQGMAIAGIALGSVSLLAAPLLAAVAIPTFLHQRDAAFSAAVASDLRNAAIEMETAYTLAGTYPVADHTPLDVALPNAGVSEDVHVMIVWSDHDGYCLEGRHRDGAVAWYDSLSFAVSEVPCG